MSKRVRITVKALVAAGDFSPVEVLTLSGYVTKRLGAVANAIQVELNRIGLNSQKTVDERGLTIAFRFSAHQWNISGVRERVKAIIDARLDTDMDDFGMMM